MPSAYRWVLVTVGLCAAGAGVPAWAAMNPVRATAETGDYRLELDVGPREQMFSKAEAERLKATSGEIMVSGQMAGSGGGMTAMSGTTSGGSMPGMAMGAAPDDAALRHLELHIRSTATGKAVRDADVGITVMDAAGGHPVAVPVAVMYGVAEGPDDWHYGNNVRLPPGHYVVQVSANHQSARFEITISDH